MNLQPLGDRLIVEVLEEEQITISGIVLPDTAQRSRSAARSCRSDQVRVTRTGSTSRWM